MEEMEVDIMMYPYVTLNDDTEITHLAMLASKDERH